MHGPHPGGVPLAIERPDTASLVRQRLMANADDVDALFVLAALRAQEGYLEEGLTILDHVLRIDPRYPGAQGILAVADLTRRDTWIALDEWARSIRSVAGDIPTYGVVNKADLERERALPPADVESFFRERGWPWSYASAKTGAGVHETFVGIVKHVLGSRA